MNTSFVVEKVKENIIIKLLFKSKLIYGIGELRFHSTAVAKHGSLSVTHGASL
jgi:hypothetical protein